MGGYQGGQSPPNRVGYGPGAQTGHKRTNGAERASPRRFGDRVGARALRHHGVGATGVDPHTFDFEGTTGAS